MTGAPVGFAGPVKPAKADVPVYAESALEGASGVVVGANQADTHLKNVDLARDAKITAYADLVICGAGDLCPGRNGIGMKHALENRIIGTKSRGVYEAPGMEVLSWGLKYIYEGVMDRRSTLLFQQLSKLVADQIYDGRWFDPATRAARAAIQVWADKATADITLGLYKGNIFFESLTGLKATIYNEADSSMEASNGLNPHSSQGFAEIQSVEAKMLAKSGQIVAK